MLERAPGGAKQAKLDAAVPHFDDRLLAAVLAHQVGLRMQPFQVAADGDRFGQMTAVVEFDKRQTAGGILREHLGLTVVAGENVDLLDRNLQSFFSYENSEPSRIR